MEVDFTSSKKRMHGAHVLARLNNVLTFSSLSPTYLFKSSGPYIKVYEQSKNIFKIKTNQIITTKKSKNEYA